MAGLECPSKVAFNVVDTKIVGLYGRGHTRLNIVDGLVRFTVHDPFDVLVDRFNPVLGQRNGIVGG